MAQYFVIHDHDELLFDFRQLVNDMRHRAATELTAVETGDGTEAAIHRASAGRQYGSP